VKNLSGIHIVAVSNDLYAKHTAVMFNSIIINKHSNQPLHLYIIGRLTDQNRKKIRHSLNKPDVFIHFFPVEETLFEGFKLFSYFKKEAYYRLLIPDLIEDDIEKVIYLDSDIIVKHDITELWNVDIKNFYLAAVQDVGYCASKKRRRVLSIPLKYGYFNSGVMLLNLKKWRENSTSNTVIEFAKNNPTKLRSIDQDALNAVLYDKWLKLHPRWNYISGRIRKKKFQKDPAIIHFTGKNKPWSNHSKKHPLGEEYFHYLQRTDW
jgi:lipopolysaccharide biosynthesis glycosyltransferase